MKWIGIVFGSLALIAALAALIGMMLPKAHRATRSAHFRQPPEVVYAVIAGPPDWRSDVKAFGKLSGGQWWEQDSHGKKITFELVEDRAPQRRVTRIADRRLPFGGTWTVEITPSSGGSAVRITEDGEIYNVIFRFVARSFLGYASTIENYLRDLGRRLQEPVQIEA